MLCDASIFTLIARPAQSKLSMYFEFFSDSAAVFPRRTQTWENCNELTFCFALLFCEEGGLCCVMRVAMHIHFGCARKVS